MKGMLYTEIDPSEIGRYIDDDRWVMEQKLDGTRVIAQVTQHGARFLQRGGVVLKHSAATQHLHTIEPELVALAKALDVKGMTLDGELLTQPGTYHLFDVVHLVTMRHYEAIVPNMPQVVRRAMLTVLGKQLTGERVSVIRQAMTTFEKQEMWEAANRAGIEGVMLKRHDAPYEPGARVMHGLKVKLVKSADVVVTGVNRGRTAQGRETGNITFGVFTPLGSFEQIGRCSVIGKPHVEPGDVIEVAYLYWTGGTTYQPRMVRVREDKRPEDCQMSQFPAYSRELV